MQRTTKSVLCILSLVIPIGLWLKATVIQVPSGTWAPAGNMADARSGAASALLQDGTILVTGGEGVSGVLSSAEFFNAGSFASAPAMNVARRGHAAVVLEDGRVLVTGGKTTGGSVTNAAEVYSPALNSWIVIGSMADARSGHTATLLKDGRVLLAGGEGSAGAVSTLEVFDPASSTFTFMGTMSSARKEHAAARLADGKVFIAGGSNGGSALASSEVYEPETGTAVAGPALSTPRVGLSATALMDGNVLIAGGNNGTSDLATAEVFNSATGTITALGSSLTPARRDHSAFLLPHNNHVLIVGGTSGGTALATAELFRPWHGNFHPTGSMSTARVHSSGSALALDGLLLVAGGSGLANSELYGFATVKTDKDDYHPGELVTMTGSGWQPGETVNLLLHEINNPDPHDDLTLTAIADTSGHILNNQFAPDEHDLGIRFYLTATGSTSQAQTTFTDGNLFSTINFSIGPTSVAPNGTLNWSVSASCRDGGGVNICASEGFTAGGAVQDGYTVNIQQATNAGFTQNLVVRATVTTTAGGSSGSFAAPATGGPYFYRAIHPNQNLSNTPVQGNDPNSWQPETSNPVTVTLVSNTPPTISNVADQTINEDANTGALAFTAGDTETAPAALTVAGSSNNTTLVPNANIVFGGSGANRTVTVTPAANQFGSATITITVTDAGSLSASDTFLLTVNAVNDAPSFNKGADQTVNEDAGAQSVAGWATAISAGPANESGQVLTFVITNNTNASLFSTGPAVDAVTGNLTYTPAANAFGFADITLKIMDNGGTANGGVNESAIQPVKITVNSVNDAPSFTKGANQTVLEDAGAQTVATWATAISAGPANESLQVLNFIVNNDNNGLFAVQPAVAANGTLTYTPAANANGLATVIVQLHDDGGTANGGIDTSASQTFTLTITPVNDVPVANDSATTTTNEDTAVGIDLGVLVSDLETADANLIYMIDSGPSHGTLTPGSGANRTYTPAADYFGSDSFTYHVVDRGDPDACGAVGPLCAGAESSAVKTVSITVNPVNDAPSFTKGANQTVLEDAGAQTVATWATAISAGPANESLQVLNFIVNNDNNGLFAVQPAVAANGTLTYTPAANANGLATVIVQLHDDGGTANGGIDTSASQTFTLTITPVNDVPVANDSATTTTNEDTAVGIDLGVLVGDLETADANLIYMIDSGPSHGTLTPGSGANRTYTPAADYFGSDSFTYHVVDRGDPDACGAVGPLCAGAESSAVKTVSITVNPVNDVPSFTKGLDQTVLEDAAAQSIAWATAISAGPANESGQVLNFIVSNTNNGLFSVQPAIAANGTLTYTPAANANGLTTVTVQLHDDGGTANGGIDTSASQTFTLTITPVNDVPWAANGTLSTPEDTALNVDFGALVSDVETSDANLIYNIITGPAIGQGVLSGSGSVRTFTPALNYNGTVIITYSVTDRGDPDNCGAVVPLCTGSASSATKTVTITVTPVNDAPEINGLGTSNSAVNEGGTITLTGSFSDPDIGDSHAITINWGDGTTNTILSLAPGVFAFSANHCYKDDNPTGSPVDSNNIVITVTDNGTPPALTDSGETQITVNNMDPAITTVSAPVDPALINTPVNIVTAFTDPGSQDTYSCQVQWDDIVTITGTSLATSGAKSCMASRTFTTAGVYSFTVAVTDDDTGTASYVSPTYVVVYDPNGGFVTGGGWINSPVGASIPYPTMTGKANFGFVSKYQKGATKPTGETEFQFKLANLNFHSTSYDWLVIGGATAQYKGLGTINGTGNYGFMLTAIDGQISGGGGTDKFRIKIWDKNNGDTIVYDNMLGAADSDNPTTALGGGSIVIHK